MAAGFTTPLSVGPGSLHILGAGPHRGMDDGTGEPLLDGTGFLLGGGVRPGFTGTMGMTIWDGARSAIGIVLWS